MKIEMLPLWLTLKTIITNKTAYYKSEHYSRSSASVSVTSDSEKSSEISEEESNL